MESKMALRSDETSEAESSSEIIEFSQHSLLQNNGNQDISFSQCQSLDQSSACSNLEDQLDDLSERINHGLLSSFCKDQNHVKMAPSLAETDCTRNPGQSGDLASDNNALGQSIDPSAGDADGDCNSPECDGANGSFSVADSRGLEVETRLPMGSSSCDANNLLGNSGVSSQQNDGSSGATSSSVFSGKRSEEGCLRQISEAGSSSRPQEVANSYRNYPSVQLNACSQPRLSIPPQSSIHMDFREQPTLRSVPGYHANSDFHPHPSPIARPGRPQEIFSRTTDSWSQHSNPHHFYPRVGSSCTNMSGTMLVPTVSRNLHQLPLTMIPNSVAGASNESGQMSNARNLSHYPQEPQHYRPVGSLGALGSASTYPTEHNLGFHPWSSVPWAPQPTHSAERQQAALEYPPWLLSPQDGSGSGVQNFGFAPRPRSTLHGYICDTLQQIGHSNLDQNPYPQGPSSSHSGQHRRRLGVPAPHVLQLMAAELDRGHDIFPEQVMLDSQRSSQLQAQARLTLQEDLRAHAFQYPGRMFSQDRHRDMRLDVDRMSYEELLALGEQIGTVRTGLREETIVDLLKRRTYECGNSTSEPSAADVTCCICRGEYVPGEEIGTLNCDHEFHRECIKQWLLLKNDCPICKMKALGS